jgi:hypothetical protein
MLPRPSSTTVPRRAGRILSGVANDVDAYLEALPEDRRATLQAVRALILANLPSGYQESMTWRMPSYEVPLERYPDTYNGKPLMYAGFASQKRYLSLYLNSVYQSAQAGLDFREAFEAKMGRPPNMGASCLRFRTLDELPLELIGTVIGSVDVDTFVELARTARSARR